MADTEKMLELAIEIIRDAGNDCPLWYEDGHPSGMDIEKLMKCPKGAYCSKSGKACWRKYLEMKARDNDA